jgi:hypothetical protein
MKPKRAVVCGLFAIVVAASVALYLGPLLGPGDVGFPLDDAWIHQTYASNLAHFGQWSYESGRPSTGSTSPLWTLALAAGYLLGVDYHMWTFALGIAAWVWTAWLARRLAARLFGGARPGLDIAVAAFCLLEWHLVWAAFSGMETLLFAALQLLCLERYLAFEAEPTGGAVRHGLVTGLCGGLLVLTRPEGLILLALIGVWFLMTRRRAGWTPRALAWGGSVAAGIFIIVGPYAAFNLHTAGFLFPTTFYAKQAEYHAVIAQAGLLSRWSSLLLTVLAGGPILLVPGVVIAIVLSLKERAAGVTLMWVWWAVYVTIYALRLPVSYQHGRYLIPTLPVFIVLGAGGTVSLVARLAGNVSPMVLRVLGRAWLAAIVSVVLLFWAIGARAYADDVRFVNGEMGETTAWLSKNVPPGARLAVHDIGMVGYFLRRPFIDLAGLVTPEIIPFISDEHRLIEYMAANRVEYLVVFPDWSEAYGRMVQDPRLDPVHRSGYAWTLAQGRANMTVYRAAW